MFLHDPCYNFGGNLGCIPMGEAQIDHTTLFKFFQLLEKNDSCQEMFVEITDVFIKACGTLGKSGDAIPV